jgi:hypothetical protein
MCRALGELRLLVMAAMAAQWKPKKDIEGREYPCARKLGKVSLADYRGELTRSIPIIVQERTKIVPRVI